LNKGTYKRKTHAQIKTIEQRYKQEENTRTDRNNWTKVHIRGNRRTDRNNWTKVQKLFLSVRVFSSCMHLCSIVFICACVFFLLVHLFNRFYLCVCFLLVRTFVQLFLYVHLFPLICTFAIEQRCIQEENTRTDKNNWIKVHKRGKHTHR
jgi:hypothetical protein